MTELLAVGQPAPDFSVSTDTAGDVSLSSFKGRRLVLYFYPKDDTPGCTTQALDFSTRAPEFERLGATVLGVSKDSVAKHAKFRSKHGLTVTLGGDEAGAMLERYGVWVEKSMYGKKMMGIERATFLIGPDGTLEAIWRKVKAAGHADAVLAALVSAKGAA